MPAISHPRPTVGARAAGWLPEWLQSSLWNGAASGACHQTHCCVVAATALARRPLFFCSCPASNLDQPRCRCICSAFLSQHTLWLIYRLHAPYRCSSLTASRSFDAGGIAYLRTNILRRSKHPSPNFCAKTSGKRWRKHPASRHQQTRHDRR